MSEALAELALRAERRKMQDEFGIRVESNNRNGQMNMLYYLGGELTGYSALGISEHERTIDWVSYFPNSMKHSHPSGYGTLTHCGTLLSLNNQFGSDWGIRNIGFVSM